MKGAERGHQNKNRTPRRKRSDRGISQKITKFTKTENSLEGLSDSPLCGFCGICDLHCIPCFVWIVLHFLPLFRLPTTLGARRNTCFVIGGEPAPRLRRDPVARRPLSRRHSLSVARQGGSLQARLDLRPPGYWILTPGCSPRGRSTFKDPRSRPRQRGRSTEWSAIGAARHTRLRTAG